MVPVELRLRPVAGSRERVIVPPNSIDRPPVRVNRPACRVTGPARTVGVARSRMTCSMLSSRSTGEAGRRFAGADPIAPRVRSSFSGVDSQHRRIWSSARRIVPAYRPVVPAYRPVVPAYRPVVPAYHPGARWTARRARAVRSVLPTTQIRAGWCVSLHVRRHLRHQLVHRRPPAVRRHRLEDDLARPLR
jgi:hypothetical protein